MGREAIVAFLTGKWNRELDYRLINEIWALRQLGKNRSDTLGRFLDQHLRRVHGHARTNRSNQACNVVVITHRTLSELYAHNVSLIECAEQFQPC